MDFAQDRQLCRLVIINKIDCPGAKPAAVLQQVRDTFGARCLPLNLPADSGTAVADCFFQAAPRATDFSTVEAAHTQIIDQVIELDERLMALYLEQGEDVSPEQLHDPF
jgi:elongation factor G